MSSNGGCTNQPSCAAEITRMWWKINKSHAIHGEVWSTTVLNMFNCLERTCLSNHYWSLLWPIPFFSAALGVCSFVSNTFGILSWHTIIVTIQNKASFPNIVQWLLLITHYAVQQHVLIVMVHICGYSWLAMVNDDVNPMFHQSESAGYCTPWLTIINI